MVYLERLGAIHQHAAFIDWCKGGRHSVLPTSPLVWPRQNWMFCPVLTRYPSETGINFEGLLNRHGALDFQDALADFIVQHNYPGLSAAMAQRRANNTLLPFRRVSVFHKVKFVNPEVPDVGTVDAVHIRPEVRSRRGHTIPGRFDTVLVKNGGRIRVAQIRVVFQFPKSAVSSIFLSSRPPPPVDLAYVEWFSPLSMPDVNHGMYRVSRSYRNNRRLASVIPLSEVCRSVHLFPVFSPVEQWQSQTVLDECRNFYVNPFLDRHMHQNLNTLSVNL